MNHPAAPPDLAGLELLADAAVVVAAGGTISYVNPHAARLMGEPAEGLVGCDAEKKLRLRAVDGSDWWECAEPMHADARLLPRIAEQELTLQVGATSRAVALTGSRIPDGRGGTQRLVLTLRRAEARRLRDAARSDLVSTVSHELRSPLTSVKGFTKTLLVKWDRFTDEQKKQMLATVNEDADRVTRLLGELLSVSRIDAGRLQLKRQMVAMGTLLPNVVAKVEAAMPEARSRVVVDVGSVPDLYADPDRLEQIIVNLVENALKYTDGTVHITVTDDEDVVCITCSDHGGGIEHQHLGAIFTKFFRRPGEKRQGTGLGLYITKGLVEAHGGEIWVTSDPGVGSTFTFTVPKGGLELAGIDLDALRASTTRRG